MFAKMELTRHDVLRRQYLDTYTLDSNPELFEKLLREVGFTIGDVGDTRMRQANKLSSYTLSLNPGVRALVKKLATFRVGSAARHAIREDDFGSITHLIEPIPIEVKRQMRFSKVIENARDHNKGRAREHKDAKRISKDDLFGRDHIGDSEYACAIAKLTTSFLEAPCVFGLFASWGKGKTFTMNKIMTYIKACAISQVVHSNGADEQLLQQLQGIAGSDGVVDLLFTWLNTGCDPRAVIEPKQGQLVSLDETFVNKKWSEQQSLLDGMTLDGGLSSLYVFLLSFPSRVISLLMSTWPCSPCRWKNPQLDLLRKAWQKRSKIDSDTDRCIDYVFVQFNAWRYCGLDSNLGVAFILKLNAAVEAHLGASYAHAECYALMIRSSVKLLIALFICLAAISVVRPGSWDIFSNTDTFSNIDSWSVLFNDVDIYIQDLMGKSAGIATAGLSSFAAARQIYKLVHLPSKPSQKLQACSSDPTDMLGGLDTLKSQIDQLTQYLNSPEQAPTCWDLLFPAGWPILAYLMSRLKGFFHKSSAYRKCRVVIFIDDLGRCPPSKVAEVLKGITLLSENCPFIFFLAVDPRVIANAIECDNTGFYRDANITGYEYLDKIIQVPFALPEMSDDEKGKLFRTLLTGCADLQVKVVDGSGDLRCYVLSEDKTRIMAMNTSWAGAVCTKFQYEVVFFKFQNGQLRDSSGMAPLPHSIAASIVRQLKSLAERRIPPCSFADDS